MTYDHATQLRVDCLSEAIRAMSITPCTADEIVKAAETFHSFIVRSQVVAALVHQSAQGDLSGMESNQKSGRMPFP